VAETRTARAVGTTRANKNKVIRQEALRQQLASQGHLQHIIDLHGKLTDKDNEIDPAMVQRIKIVMESKHKLVDKYLPTPKQIEIREDNGMEDMTEDELDAAIAALRPHTES
jgi:hypothetical protein